MRSTSFSEPDANTKPSLFNQICQLAKEAKHNVDARIQLAEIRNQNLSIDIFNHANMTPAGKLAAERDKIEYIAIQ